MRIVVFRDDSFPSEGICPLSQENFDCALEGFQVDYTDFSELSEALAHNSDVFINPYGSAFPKSLWPYIFQYLQNGGSWVNLGGTPLTRPVRRSESGWKTEPRQFCYSKEVGIHQAFETPCEGLIWHWQSDFEGYTPEMLPVFDKIWSLQVRLSDVKDFPDECGSGSSRLANIRTLLTGLDGNRRLAAPVVVIDRLLGDFAGGTWVFLNADISKPLNPELIRGMVKLAVRGPVEFSAQPVFGCVYPGETPSIRVSVKSHRMTGDFEVEAEIWDDACPHGRFYLCGKLSDVPLTEEINLPNLAGAYPGLYKARLKLLCRGTVIKTCETGFWIYDDELLKSGEPLRADADYFRRGGVPYPVAGTTYMCGEKHRKFLFEPNPARWDTDFAEMKQAGVNMVRTGVWTGWSRIMLDPGAIDEGFLRNLTAWVLTARKYDIPVIFTFFAFLPPTWGGKNPFLDPRAISAQSAFVASIVRRLKNAKTIMWDLINEPSFCSLERLWYVRPNYDRFEQSAWNEWLESKGYTEDELRERWKMASGDVFALPDLKDFDDLQIYQGTHPLRAMDYRLFAQEKFADWAAEMRRVIRESGNPDQLITVGQDEGGTGERPSPHFYGKAVDFTSNHSWWQNDDLLWDSIITKTPDKPNLIEETGIMFVESPDGSAWRTPDECARLLERKMALSFAGGCAGFIQWLWNTNIYMDSDNEVGIGFFRADGTEKPELEAFRRISVTVRGNAPAFNGRKQPDVCLIIPHSSLYSARNLADQATRRAVRALEYSLGVSCRAVSEYRADEAAGARLIILPSARNLTINCREQLLAIVEQGSILLVTGYAGSDEAWRPAGWPEFDKLGIEARPVSPYMSILLGEKQVTAEFRGEAITRYDAGYLPNGRAAELFCISHGNGQILYCPVPVELASNSEVTVEVYKEALIQSGIGFQNVNQTGLLIKREDFENTYLIITLNESGQSIETSVSGQQLTLQPGEARLLFIPKDA